MLYNQKENSAPSLAAKCMLPSSKFSAHLGAGKNGIAVEWLGTPNALADKTEKT